ncbi:hypothetical protein SUGI_0771150 [Cryptomeria japonica]|nr:hypothetical protein SUGI_0771150 [Cryptomeria japonica]
MKAPCRKEILLMYISESRRTGVQLLIEKSWTRQICCIQKNLDTTGFAGASLPTSGGHRLMQVQALTFLLFTENLVTICSKSRVFGELPEKAR